MTYQWTTRNGIGVTSDVPRHRILHDIHPATHIVWSYSHWIHVLATGFAGIAADRITSRRTK